MKSENNKSCTEIELVYSQVREALNTQCSNSFALIMCAARTDLCDHFVLGIYSSLHSSIDILSRKDNAHQGEE